MWKIKKSLIEDAKFSAINFLPYEFMCFLAGDLKKHIINEIVFLPTTNSKNSASINLNIIPFDNSIIGSMHSHPTGNATPSFADLKFFQKYSINAIIGVNYQNTIINFYNNKGEKITIKEY